MVAYEGELIEQTVQPTDVDPIPHKIGTRLYKYDSKDKLRVWWMEYEGAKHRTVSGLNDGALTYSEWTICIGKQKRTDEEQAVFEFNAGYTYQLKREYFTTPEEAEGGARFFKPMLAEKWEDMGWDKAVKLVAKAGLVTDGATGIYGEPKLDGFCCIAQPTGLTSREGEPIVAVPHVSDVLQAFWTDFPESPLHGELYNHDLKDDFETLSSILRKTKNITPEQFETARVMQYHVYDYPAPHVRHLPYSQRKAALKRELGPYLEAAGGTLVIVDGVPLTSAAHVDEQRDVFLDLGFEGQMVKLDIEEYVQKRSKQNNKNKVTMDDEFEVVSIEEGVGNYAGYAKKVVCWRKGADRSAGPTKDNTFKAGVKGGKKPRFLIDAFRAEGHKVVTLTFFGYTKAGIPRHGRTKAWHGKARVL